MRSQPNCFRLFCFVVVVLVVLVVFGVIVDVVFVFVVILNVDVVVLATSKVDLRLLVMEVEFGVVVGGVVVVVCEPIFMSNPTQLS